MSIAVWRESGNDEPDAGLAAGLAVATGAPLDITSRVEAALTACFEAYVYAQDLRRCRWDFAVEIATLRQMGLSRSALRWLIGKGLLQCGVEDSVPGGSERVFRHSARPIFCRKTCFVLTDAGVEAAQQIYGLGEPGAMSPSLQPFAAAPTAPALPRAGRVTPTWDRDRQVLRIGSVVVKQFKVPAVNQETVLSAFEEESWPPRIDDPLPPHHELAPKRRLQETIKSLNRNQKHLLIRFIGDGSGQGVRWELCGNAAPRTLE